MDSTLRKPDWLRLQETLLDLHGAPSLAELPARVLAGVRRVIACETVTVQDDRGGVRRVPWRHEDELWQPDGAAGAADDVAPGRGELGLRMMLRWEHDFSRLREAFFAFSAEKHPHTEHFRRTGDGSARRLLELITPGALRRTRFFNEIARPQGSPKQLTFYASLPGGATLMVAAARRGRDFTADDRARLELLRAHITLAWTRALERQRQERALRRLRGGGRTAATALAAEDDPAAGARALHRCFRLAPREAETLFWVAQGKTNAEIGIILDLSPATVKGYVERLLARLGCPTRTAAARAALEALAER